MYHVCILEFCVGTPLNIFVEYDNIILFQILHIIFFCIFVLFSSVIERKEIVKSEAVLEPLIKVL